MKEREGDRVDKEMAGTNQRPRASRKWRAGILPIAVPALLALVAIGADGGSAAASTASSSSIEGVWSFNGGQIAIRSLDGETLEGKVVAETKFAECTHPVGQTIWSEIRPQPDGSYDGFHQWYFEGPACVLNPTLGPTAWRVLQTTGGAHYLRACFSAPGGSQPTIAPDGTPAGVSYGCVDSARVAALPGSAVLSLRRLASLPSAKKCLSRRVFQIHVRDPALDPFKLLVITVAGRRIGIARRGKYSIATVDLRGFRRGAFTLSIRGTTVLGRRLYGRRVYHTCVRKAARVSPRHGHGH